MVGDECDVPASEVVLELLHGPLHHQDSPLYGSVTLLSRCQLAPDVNNGMLLSVKFL